MTSTIRLNDLQLVLLSSAAARDNGSLIPLPESCTQDRAGIGRAVTALLRRALIEELPATDQSLAWREQDQDPFGLFITDAGRAAIGSEPEQDFLDQSAEAGAVAEANVVTAEQAADEQPVGHPEAAPPSSANALRSGSKIAAVVALLEREQGATLDEMVEATGWLPHSTRAALTGLRKKGRAIAKDKLGNATCYRIKAAVA